MDEGGKEALGGGWCGFAEEAAAGRGHVAPEYMLQALFSFTNSTGCHSTAINRSGIAQLKHESRANVLFWFDWRGFASLLLAPPNITLDW